MKSVFALIAAIGLLLGVFPGGAASAQSRVYEPVSLADTDVTFAGEAPQVVSASTSDGLELTGAYWSPVDGVDQLVVVYHGNSYNHLVMAVRAEPLRVGGRGVLIASYRGFGDNPGKPTEDGLYRDAEAWLAKARELQPTARIYLFGFSMGGSVALEMAARHEIEAVATMGAFTSLKDAAPPLARPFIRERYDNRAKIPLVEEPVLMLHGSKDSVVDPAHGKELAGLGGENTIHINLVGGEHWVPIEALAAKIWEKWEESAEPIDGR